MKIICVGRNYADHAKELNNQITTDPILFMKPKSALLTDNKALYYPEYTNDLHYEGEIVIRISKNGKYINEKFASNYYDQLTIGIDFTARDLQNELKSKGLPWEISKSFDGSAAVGSFIPTSAFKDVQNINFSLNVSGETRQSGNTADMLFSINKVIAYASQFFTLHIGDLIFTGTPKGVGSLSVTDHIEGFVEGEKLLSCTIK